MPAAGLVLALCALLQLCPAALGALRPQLLVERSGSRRLSKVRELPKPSSPLPWLQGRGVQGVWGGFVGEQRAVRSARRALSTPRGFAREQICFLPLPERPVQCPGVTEQGWG